MKIMKQLKRIPRRRIFPERVLPPEEIARRQAEMAAFQQRCWPIFERVRNELYETHYGWYVAIDPDSGEYFLHQDILQPGRLCREKYPHVIPHVFQINDVGGVCGRV